MPRQSAHIHAREATVSADDFPSHSMEVSESDRLWCSCGGWDDGRLMLYCDRQCEGCCVWYHHDCLGLSLAEVGGWEPLEQNLCPHCTDIDTSTPSDHPTSATIEQDPSTIRDSSHIFKPCTE